MSEVIVLPKAIVDRVRKEAERRGLSLGDYIIDLLSQGLDPKDRAREYVIAAEELLKQAEEELKKEDLRQAAEKAWGATALAVKVYAYWKEGKRLSSHGELWEYSRVISKEMGTWVLEVWNQASGMHTCFYEGWCTKEHINAALKSIEKTRKRDCRDSIEE